MTLKSHHIHIDQLTVEDPRFLTTGVLQIMYKAGKINREQRREVLSLRFVKNSLKNANFLKLFPLKKANHLMDARNPIKYHVSKANTERYRRTTIPYLQRQLNSDVLKRKLELKDLQTFNATKRKRTRNNNHSELVNYVSIADPIT